MNILTRPDLRSGFTMLMLTLLPTQAAWPQAVPARHLHLWARTFIGAPTSGAAVGFSQTTSGKWVVHAPFGSLAKLASLPTECFTTDDRGFDSRSDVSVPVRIAFEADIVLTGRDMTVTAYKDHPMSRTGVTRNVDCKTGRDLQPPKQAPLSSVSIGTVKTGTDGWRKVVYVSVSGGDPFYEVAGINFAARVDFNVTISFDPLVQRIDLVGTTGTFPSFEMYYSINEGAVRTVLNFSPPVDASPMTLFDFGTGLNTRNFSEKIQLPL